MDEVRQRPGVYHWHYPEMEPGSGYFNLNSIVLLSFFTISKSTGGPDQILYRLTHALCDLYSAP